MNTTDLFVTATQNITSDWLMLLFKIILVGVCCIILKNIIENLAFYVMFRWNKFFKKGSLIKYKSYNWVIRNATMTFIELESDNGFMYVPIKKWKTSQFILLKIEERYKGQKINVSNNIPKA